MRVEIFFLLEVFSVLVASLSQVLLKKAAMKEHGSFIKEYLNIEVLFGYAMLVLSTVLTIIAFTRIDFKNAPVIESLGYVFVMFLSLWFFKEKITKKKLIGNILILLGIFVFYL